MILADGIQYSLDTMDPFWNVEMDIVARLPDMNGPRGSLTR